ncbi:MAG TPA: biopolymer transporter ExbD [Caulobacteraceae bacterium]|jgi:biopolymer transport protein ExbD|nr:biopolymer transporter ExbD [Caulobacteraceae bacterium]
MAAKLAGPGGGRFQVEMNHEINVTPFVDVMLVLLIIFMVAAPLASVNVKINLPPANAKPQTKPPQIIYVSIKADGTYYVGDNQTDLSELPDALKLAAGPSHVGLRIFIRGDQDVEYGKFLDAMNTMQDNGFYSVALVGEDRSGVGAKK